MSASYEQDFVRGSDGVFVFWPREENGAYPSHLLREIAARLDQLNEEGRCAAKSISAAAVSRSLAT